MRKIDGPLEARPAQHAGHVDPSKTGTCSKRPAGAVRPMPQVQLPIFPAHSTSITPELAFEQRDGQVVYFNGHLPVFIHEEKDLASFRLFTCQLVQNGTATQSQIAAAFGVSLTTVKRYCKVLRSAGAAGFFVTPKPKSGQRLTPDLLIKVQSWLDLEWEVPAIGRKLGILPNTIHKAIRAGRLKKKKQR